MSRYPPSRRFVNGGHHHPSQRRELVVLPLVLSAGAVGATYLVHLWMGAADHHGYAAVAHGVRDALISLPVAFAAVGAGQWLSRRRGAQRAGHQSALSRVWVMSLVFAALSVPSVGVHRLIDGYLDGPDAHATHAAVGLEHDGSLVGLAAHGFRDALIGQVVALPLLFLAIGLLSRGAATHRASKPVVAAGGRPGRRGSARPGSRLAVRAVFVLVVLALSGAVTGALAAAGMVSGHPGTRSGQDGRALTSFGALWVESFGEISIPKTVHKGHVGFPQGGSPDKIALQVIARLANTTAAPVELKPDRFALRIGATGETVAVEAAAFDSVHLLPGAVFDARLQFPVNGGERQLSLVFSDPDGARRISIELGQGRSADSPDEHSDNHQH